MLDYSRNMLKTSEFNMDFPKFKPIHAKNPKAIIVEACKTMGLSLEEFVSTLESDLDCKIDLANPLVSEWVYMCELLALEFDSISYGYLDYFHKRRISKYKEEEIAHQEFYPKTYNVVSRHLTSRFSSQHSNSSDLHA